jgi:hypothetical protein
MCALYIPLNSRLGWPRASPKWAPSLPSLYFSAPLGAPALLSTPSNINSLFPFRCPLVLELLRRYLRCLRPPIAFLSYLALSGQRFLIVSAVSPPHPTDFSPAALSRKRCPPTFTRSLSLDPSRRTRRVKIGPTLMIPRRGLGALV